MNQTPILSIIVPSYNMEKYLPKCLGSLIVAPELMEKLEVIVVNDGSKDRTSEIAHEFESKWPQTFKVIDKENGNYGSCINAALPIATGKYVKVLDADDSFDTEAFADYLAFLSTVPDTDLVVTDYDTVDETGCVTWHHAYEFVTTDEFTIDDYLASKSYLPMHALTYRTALLQEMKYRQLEGVSYTDTEWSFLPLTRVRTVRYCPKTVYKYLFGRVGQTMEAGKIAKSWWMRGEVALDAVEKFKLLLDNTSVQVASVLLSRLESLVESVYRGGVFGCAGWTANVDLIGFDKNLKVLDSAIYDSMALVVFSRRLPYRYIRGWRRHSLFWHPLEWLCKVYAKVVKGTRR